MDVNGRGAVQCRSEHEPSPHRRPDGDGLDAVRTDRPRDSRDADRPHRGRGRGVASAGVGRRADARHRPAPLRGLHLGHLPCVRLAGCGDRGRHDAVHGGSRSHTTGHCQRTGIPRPARRRRGPRQGRPPRRVAGTRGDRRRPADPAVDRCRRPDRGLVRARCGRLLGWLHPAHPARRRRGLGHQRAGSLDARRRSGRDHSSSAPRCCRG